MNLKNLNQIFVQQRHELAELVFNFETRNKYRIMDENKNIIGYAAEQQKGFFGFLFRQFLGHWRKFEVHFYNNDRKEEIIAFHPFRWYFERIEVRTAGGMYLGSIQKRFSFFTKKFEVVNEHEVVIMEVSSPIWKFWTFTFISNYRKVAEVKKKWSGLFSEGFTDRDNFLVSFTDPNMTEANKNLVMVSSVFIDLLYFERKK